MNNLDRMAYYAGRKRRTDPSMRFAPSFGPRMGPRVVGVFLVLVVISFFSDFPVFLFGGIVFYFLLPALVSSARRMEIFERGSSSPPAAPENHKEKELLATLARYGEITPTRAALETSLSVSEADRMLSELTKNGHIEVRAREGGLSYALWEHDRPQLPD
jgi:hypothetical protein